MRTPSRFFHAVLLYTISTIFLSADVCAQHWYEEEPFLVPNGSFFESSLSRLFTSQENLYYLGGGTIATLLALKIDNQVMEKLGGHDDLHTTLGATLGGPFVLSTSAILTYAGGHLLKKPELANTGLFLMESLAVTYLLTTTLKALIQRPRPDGSNSLSFPSGHTSGSFAFAAVLDRRYGWRAGVPGYLFASAVGLSRIRLSKHFLSDVLGGATLGLIIGRSFSVPRGKAARLSWRPELGIDYAGLSMRLLW